MLLVFHSKASGDVLMLAQHALPVLRAAGKDIPDSGPVPERGVFVAAQLQSAIDSLEQAIAAERPQAEPEEDDTEKVPAMAQTVGLRQRAYPLLDMLRQAQRKNVDVLWEPASAW